MPSENEMFYSVTQRGLDKWNGSFFCGSAALLRRAALETTGGFSGITITEDCETAFELHAKGWTSVFVDKPLIAGLQPETFASFIGQRSRWCQGMFQILLLKNPAFKTRARLHPAHLLPVEHDVLVLPAAAADLHVRAAALHLPRHQDLRANIDEAIAYTGTYIVVNMMLQNYPLRPRALAVDVRALRVRAGRVPVEGDRLGGARARASRPSTSPPRACRSTRTISPNWPGRSSPSSACSCCGAGVAAWRYMFEPGVTNLMLVVGLWNGFNMMIAGAALGVVAERRAPDRHPRLGIERSGALEHRRRGLPGRSSPDVSTGGCALRAVDGSLPADMKSGRLHIVPIGSA